MDFLIWKFLHITAVIVFLGNIATGFYWQYHGEAQGNVKALLATFEGLHRSDQWITNPCIVLIIISGLGMGYSVGFELLFQNWLYLAYLLMAVAGLAYVLKLIPLHEEMIALLKREKFEADEWQQYRLMKRRWKRWAGTATILPFLVFGLMYFKPVLNVLA